MKGSITLKIVLSPGENTNIILDKADVEMGLIESMDLDKAVKSFTAKLNKIQGVDDPRCKDCKHWGKGKATINAWDLSYVCFKQRKKILHPKFKDQVIYYAKPRLCKACDEFEQKEK